MHGLTNCGSWGQIPQHALENVRLKLLITLEKRLWGSLPTVRRILNGYQKRYKTLSQNVSGTECNPGAGEVEKRKIVLSFLFPTN